MVQDTLSTGQVNLKRRDVFQVSASWSGIVMTYLTYQPSGHSDCITSMYLQLHHYQNAILLCMYAPTLLVDSAKMDMFYTDLQKIPPNYKIIILSNFISRVGWDFEAWKGMLGKHGKRSCNGNGHLFLGILYKTAGYYNLYLIPAEREPENYLDASSIKTLASNRLYSRMQVWPERCLSYKSDVTQTDSLSTTNLASTSSPNQAKMFSQWGNSRCTASRVSHHGRLPELAV